MSDKDIEWTDEQLEEAGIDKARLAKIIGHLKAASKLMNGTGLSVYGSDGSGYLTHVSRPEHFDPRGGRNVGEPDFDAIIASVGEGFDGGGW